MRRNLNGSFFSYKNPHYWRNGRALQGARRTLIGRAPLPWKLAAIVGACILVLLGCAEPLPIYRYKITVEVETPGGVRSGSAVREVRSHDQGKGFPGPEAGGVRKEVSGEAVAVDLPNGETLFALLKGNNGSVDHAKYVAQTALYEEARALPEAKGKLDGGPFGKVERRFVLQLLREHHLSAELSPDDYPLLVRFRDIDDPTSVERVEPDDLAASFGDGYALRRIAVETTGGPVTRGGPRAAGVAARTPRAVSRSSTRTSRSLHCGNHSPGRLYLRGTNTYQRSREQLSNVWSAFLD